MVFESLHWLRITDAIWYKVSELAFMLRRKGITVSAMDALIASVAMEYDTYLLHRDKDYDLIAEHSALKIYR
jgi:predicted nucleic acid-binding protein